MKSRWIMAAAAAGAVALLTVPMVLNGRSGRSAAEEIPPPKGSTCKAERAANLSLTVKDTQGKSVKLADYKGKVVLLNFWATWCGPCKMEIPDLVAAYNEHRDQGLVVLGVLTEDEPTPKDLAAFTSEFKMNYPLVMMQEDVDLAYGPIFGLPTTFFIGRDGSICNKHLGPITKEAVEKEIRALL
jgi:cytochrome c biogenesis protein CcmG/thiol:disulfide interchange protein DsbE